MGTLKTIRQKVRNSRYELTEHAREEMTDDELETADVRRAILYGRLERVLTDDHRGARYLITGRARDGRETTVVCRILPSGTLRIVTVWTGE